MQDWSKRSVFRRPLSTETQKAHWALSTDEESGDDFAIDSISDLLTQGVESLSKLAFCFREELNFAAMVRHLRDVSRLVHGRLGTAIPPAEQYRIILPFTCWFTRDAASCYISVSRKDPRILTFLLHMYAVVLSLTLALPVTDFSIFASFRVRAILEISEALDEKEEFMCEACNKLHYSSQLTAFPISAVRQYRRLGKGRLDLLS